MITEIITKIKCFLFWADKIDDIYEEVYDLRKDVDRLEDELYSASEKIDTLRTQITGLEAEYSELKELMKLNDLMNE